MIQKDKIACKECGLILQKPIMDLEHQFYCPRCNALIYRYGQSYHIIMILTLTSLILFFPAIFLPLLSLEILDIKQTVNLVETLIIFVADGYVLLSLFATVIAIVVPIVMLSLILMILIPIRNGKSPKEVSKAFKVYEFLLSWQMADVYLVSVIVAIVKLQKMATLEIGMGFYCFTIFLLMLYVTIQLFNPYDIWNQDEVKE